MEWLLKSILVVFTLTVVECARIRRAILLNGPDGVKTFQIPTLGLIPEDRQSDIQLNLPFAQIADPLKAVFKDPLKLLPKLNRSAIQLNYPNQPIPGVKNYPPAGIELSPPISAGVGGIDPQIHYALNKLSRMDGPPPVVTNRDLTIESKSPLSVINMPFYQMKFPFSERSEKRYLPPVAQLLKKPVGAKVSVPGEGFKNILRDLTGLDPKTGKIMNMDEILPDTTGLHGNLDRALETDVKPGLLKDMPQKMRLPLGVLHMPLSMVSLPMSRIALPMMHSLASGAGGGPGSGGLFGLLGNIVNGVNSKDPLKAVTKVDFGSLLSPKDSKPKLFMAREVSWREQVKELSRSNSKAREQKVAPMAATTATPRLAIPTEPPTLGSQFKKSAITGLENFGLNTLRALGVGDGAPPSSIDINNLRLPYSYLNMPLGHFNLPFAFTNLPFNHLSLPLAHLRTPVSGVNPSLVDLFQSLFRTDALKEPAPGFLKGINRSELPRSAVSENPDSSLSVQKQQQKKLGPSDGSESISTPSMDNETAEMVKKVSDPLSKYYGDGPANRLDMGFGDGFAGYLPFTPGWKALLSSARQVQEEQRKSGLSPTYRDLSSQPPKVNETEKKVRTFDELFPKDDEPASKMALGFADGFARYLPFTQEWKALLDISGPAQDHEEPEGVNSNSTESASVDKETTMTKRSYEPWTIQDGSRGHDRPLESIAERAQEVFRSVFPNVNNTLKPQDRSFAANKVQDFLTNLLDIKPSQGPLDAASKLMNTKELVKKFDDTFRFIPAVPKLNTLLTLPNALITSPLSLFTNPLGFFDTPLGYMNLPFSHFNFPFSHFAMPFGDLDLPLDEIRVPDFRESRTDKAVDSANIAPSMLEILSANNPLQSYINMPLAETNLPLGILDLPYTIMDMPLAHMQNPTQELNTPLSNIHLPWQKGRLPFAELKLPFQNQIPELLEAVHKLKIPHHVLPELNKLGIH